MGAPVCVETLRALAQACHSVADSESWLLTTLR